MIKINLLPIEKRKPERTPLPRFFLIIVGAVLASLIVVYLLYIYIDIGKVNRDSADLEKKQNELRAGETEYNDLDKKKTAIEARLNDMKQVVQERPVYWTQIIDALWEVVFVNDRIWLEDFKTLDGKLAESEFKRANPQSKITVKYGMVFKCGAAGDDATHITAFRSALQNHPVLSRYFEMINLYPEWTSKTEQDAVEKMSLGFTVSMFKLGAPVQPPTPPPPPQKK